ncbi:hypothetical protein SAMN04488238_1037 [Roseicitreum antarcticum]|uniref:Uncharacterized protein n=1 Tax=Roseicitreum antarcticum TaxID=564137 RepID=A0A1H2VAI5_9RHOB|nr:hypothetical protein SAMN04488238_1037 [Roseicitreum antarcticum]
MEAILRENPGMARIGEPHALARTGISTMLELYAIGGEERIEFFIEHMREQWADKSNDGNPTLVALIDCYEGR